MSTSAESTAQELDLDSSSDAEQAAEVNFLDLPDDQVDDAMFKMMADDDTEGDGSASAGTPDEEEEEGEVDGGGDESDILDIDDNSFVDPDTEDAESDNGDEDADEGSEDDSDSDEEEDTESDADEESEDDDEEDPEKTQELITGALEDLAKILSPFKANGRDIQVETVDDALALMQMGANYNKKMAALKPNLKFVKMLQQNDLLDESKLSMLIDVSSGDPKAIARFLKESKIDPESVVGDDADAEYSPGQHAVNDQEIELDNVLDDLRGNESFTRTVDVVSNQWDPESKAIIFKDPKIITVIDSHIQSGIFDKISKRMESEKMLGRLDGVSDIVAYKKIGDQLDAAGLLTEPQPTKASTPAKKQTVTKQAAKKVDKALNAKRKAAGATKKVASKPKTNLDDLNPLSMSDEDFDKVAGQTLYI